jgi:predicted TIM-barrel fold metal-dependent hydrolase
MPDARDSTALGGAALDGISLVDHHCHGVRTAELDRAAVEADLTEASGSGAWHGSMFDTQAGLAVRRWCAPLLDLPSHADADFYVSRRAELGAAEVNRRLVNAAGIEDFVVDTGYLGDQLTSPDELAGMAGGRGHEIVRLEQVAEQVIGARDYADAFRTELAKRAETAVGFKSIAAYRVGLDLDPDPPSDSEVTEAADAWARAGGGRLADGVLIRFGIWAALEHRLPVQFHVGYGDSDVDMLRCDPLHLTALLRATQSRGVPIMLLHNYPFHRNAAYLAQVFDHVFVDVGLAMQNVGDAGARRVLSELLEIAPFGSVLFSTDAFGLAELYVTSTVQFRRALGFVLDEGLRDDAWTVADAERIAQQIGAGNARRVYGI